MPFNVMTSLANHPIGVFDSGIGGLSVLRHIRTHLPHEDVLYFADSGFAPYGDKPEHEIVARALDIAKFLLQQGAKALVVACNTATAASIKALRTHYPDLIFVGVEPGLKPAAAATKTGTVGVLATQRTLASTKFQRLHEQMSATTGVRFLPQACIGLADQIENGEVASQSTGQLIERYVLPLLEQGADVLVLGCTHYPFIRPLIENLAGPPLTIIDTGEAVASQLRRLLMQQGLQTPQKEMGTLEAFTSGNQTSVAMAFLNLLQLSPPVTKIEMKQD